uniref:RNA binding motif protein 33a n=1 Tax=Oryzias latipes TaxID=8090 RepID=A0A3P9HQL7_ORYLA
MSANAQDFEFEYDKPGAERSRRRRGEDDTIESDLEEDLLGEDWLSSKKNPSEVSDEELNDDLLQSDDEDAHMGEQHVNATYNMGTSYDEDGNLQDIDYTDDVMNLGVEGCEEGDEGEGVYQQEEEEAYTEEYSQEDNPDISEDQIEYAGDLCEDDNGYQDEVLDIQINEPIDGEFQDEAYRTSYGEEPLHMDGTAQEEDAEENVGEELQGQEGTDLDRGGVYDTEEGENETMLHDESKEESNEEEEEDEESGRLRFKSERKDGAIERLADASNKRRNIPDKLELSEKAKKDLMEFEEQERQKRQNRYGGRGGGRGGRGGRGRGGFPGFGSSDFRGGKRGRMHEQMPPLMGNMNIQPSSRMPPPHQHQLPSHQHHPSRPRGPHPFQDHGRPLPQQSLQPLMPPHMAHRSPPLRPQMDTSPRMMSSPPPNFPQHHQQQPPHPKNIHINPHFRGPSQSSVQVPLMPPAQSQPRPAVGPQRFPGPGDFQQHLPGNFGQPQRPPHHMEPLRSQSHQGPQDREPMFMGERVDSVRFPGQHMFDHQGPGPLLNSGNSLHHQQLPGQGHMGFGPPRPSFNQPGQSPLGLFQREPSRPNLPPHQGHQGMVNFNQQGGPPNQPRSFMGPRQPFGQQGNIFPHPQVQFGMQVRLRGLMPGPPVSSLPHHDPLSSHPMHQQHHRQELPPHQHPQVHLGEPLSMMHHGQNPFHQPHAHGSPRQMTGRPSNAQVRGMSNRHRMSAPASKQMQQRNSNLRELPVATNTTNMNSSRPTQGPASSTANIKTVARTTQRSYPGQTPQPMSGVSKGRGQAVAKTEPQPAGAGKPDVRMEVQSTPLSTTQQDPNEDEETRQYRLKIEEQKRLREEILRRKEMRRQMQAGVRKKELLERLNSKTNTQSQGTAQTQAQPNQQMQHPVQQQQQPLLQADQKRPLQQRQFPQQMQQTSNQTPRTLNQDNSIPPNSGVQIPASRPNVKERLQLGKSTTQQNPVPGSEPQWKQHQQNQQQAPHPQRRNSILQGVNRPNAAPPTVQTSQNIPVTPSLNQGPAQTQGPKPGAKRTVMQRARTTSTEGQQVPQKVRVVKLSGLSGKGLEANSSPVQQQGNWEGPPLNQGIQRMVTIVGQQQQGPGGALQANRVDISNQQQGRVVVSGRGRGSGNVGRGRPVSARQTQREAENQRRTVSIEGLSTSTTEYQLKNLLGSIGPIEMFKLIPQQRKAVAKFANPQHALNFQMSFHRHMIDLSHIDVSLIDG